MVENYMHIGCMALRAHSGLTCGPLHKSLPTHEITNNCAVTLRRWFISRF